jgi:hypothetical protein
MRQNPKIISAMAMQLAAGFPDRGLSLHRLDKNAAGRQMAD